MGKRRHAVIQVLSMATSGDPTRQKAGSSQVLRNVLTEEGPMLVKRDGWNSSANASVTTLDSFMVWANENAGTEHLIGQSGGSISERSGAGWETLISGAIAGQRDHASFDGTLYFMSGYADTAVQRYSYDGTTLSTDPFGAKLSSVSVCPWIGRLFLGGCWQSITNELGESAAYVAGWSAIAGDIRSYTSGTGETITTIGQTYKPAAYTVPSSTFPTYLVWLSHLLPQSASYSSPMTLSINVDQTLARTTAYLVGTIRLPVAATGYRYRNITAGTTAAGEPAYTTTVGGTTTDGSSVWVNEGPVAFASVELDLPTSTETAEWQTYIVKAKIPPQPATMTVELNINFGNTSRPTYTAVPVGVAFKDGLADDNPAKRNYGQQLTVGLAPFAYEFFNLEDDATVFLPLRQRVYFSEPLDASPTGWRAENYIDFTDTPGPITAVRTINADVLAIFKRNSILTVRPGPSARVPLIRGDLFRGVGALHARAVDHLEGLTFFIGERGVFVFDGASEPTEITTDSIRDALFDRGAAWVESASDSDESRPTLRVHRLRREIWVLTQQPKLFVYSIDRKAWTYVDIIKNSSGAAANIADFIYFGGIMHAVTPDNGPVYEDPATLKDETAAGTSFFVPAEVWFSPLELPDRRNVLVELAGFRHEITGTQTANDTLQAATSRDNGVTFDKTHTVTIPVVSSGGFAPIRIALRQGAGGLTVKMTHTGSAGRAYFNMGDGFVWYQTHGESEPAPANPATVSASL